MKTTKPVNKKRSRVRKVAKIAAREPAVEDDCKQLNIDVKGKNYIEIDHLDETNMENNDYGDFRNLHFLVMSFISPDHIQKNTELKHGMMKIWGGFPKDEPGQEKNLRKAQLFCDYLRSRKNSKGDQIGGYFDYFICEGGKWMPIHPSPEQIEDENYREKGMNEFVKSWKKKRDLDAVEHVAELEQIKRDVKDTTLKSYKERDPKQHAAQMKLLEKLKNSKTSDTETIKPSNKTDNDNDNDTDDETVDEHSVIGDKSKDINDLEEIVKEEEKIGNEERMRLISNKEKLEEEKSKLSTVDDRLKKIQELYKTLNNKKTKSSSTKAVSK